MMIAGFVALMTCKAERKRAPAAGCSSGIWLIDWDYAGFNSPLFDLAGLASNSDMSAEQELQVLELYYGEKPDSLLVRRYHAMKCASLLRETMWSMVSELTSELDFDYAAYTAENLAAFRQSHTDFLTM